MSKSIFIFFFILIYIRAAASAADYENEFVKISVSDNGVGIKDENIKKLFNFNNHFSTKGTNDEKGTGLGLLICKEMIEKHGGSINVASEEGKGTTFSFTLPLSKVN